jgi:hypothetical protein
MGHAVDEPRERSGPFAPAGSTSAAATSFSDASGATVTTSFCMSWSTFIVVLLPSGR